MSEGCPRCGVRGDVGCKHQPAAGSPPPAIRDGKTKKKGGPQRDAHSLWGWKGNPSGPSAARLKESLRKLKP